MSKHRQLLYGQPVQQSFFDALQEFISTMSGNLVLAVVGNTTVQAAAGPGNAQVGIGINGLWRYNSATVTANVGPTAGVYDIFVTASNNNFVTNPTPPPPENDQTTYSFALAALLQPQTPTAVPNFRKVGEASFNGTRITSLRQTVGGVSPSVALGHPTRIFRQAAEQLAAGSWGFVQMDTIHYDPDGLLNGPWIGIPERGWWMVEGGLSIGASGDPTVLGAGIAKYDGAAWQIPWRTGNVLVSPPMIGSITAIFNQVVPLSPEASPPAPFARATLLGLGCYTNVAAANIVPGGNGCWLSVQRVG